MDKGALFEVLGTYDATMLLPLLSRAYDQMGPEQRQAVFGAILRAIPRPPVEAEALLEEVEAFRRESLAGVYYAPFAMNSKNYQHIPQQTREWFRKLDDLLTASGELTTQGEHRHAAACFTILFELIETMEMGDEIVFAHELGSWMIPGDEREFVAAYLTSLAATATPEEFAAAAVPLIRRDSHQSFTLQAYTHATAVADQAQRAQLETALQQQKFRTGPKV